MSFKTYFYELDKLELKQQRTSFMSVLILLLLSDSLHKEIHSIIIYILLTHIVFNYFSLPQKNIRSLLFILGFTTFTLLNTNSAFKLPPFYLLFIAIEFALGLFYYSTKNKVVLIPIILIITILPLLRFINPAVEKILNETHTKIEYIKNAFEVAYVILIFFGKVQYVKQIHNLRKKYSRTQPESQDTTIDDIKSDTIESQKLVELSELAFVNHSVFLIKFEEYYPHFTTKIESLIPNIVPAEYEVISLLKLNFTTKEIARITNSTIRSVESKKYRIRKKLNIPKELDILIFIAQL
jgi:DNA-binding CsgD family transcriptional regulator